MRRQPRHVVIDGTPMVALTPRDFESLAAVRRQLGGQGAKLRSVRDALITMTDFLETLGDALRQGERGANEHGPPPPDPVIDDLLAALPGHVRHARKISGRSDTGARKAPYASGPQERRR